jgi:hypothetical protein
VTATLRPTSELVAVGWLRLALPGVSGVDTRLPAADDAMRASGFVRVDVVGGSPALGTPAWREPVLVAECWVPPADGSHVPPWNQSGQIAQNIIDATDDWSLRGVTVDLSGIGDGEYGNARVDSVVARSEPVRVPADPNNYARTEIRIQVFWVAA